MTTGFHGVLAGTTEFLHRCEILPQKRDGSVVFSLGAETGALMEQLPITVLKKVIYPLTRNT